MDLWDFAHSLAPQLAAALCVLAARTAVAGLLSQSRYGGVVHTSNQMRDAGFTSIDHLLGDYPVVGAISHSFRRRYWFWPRRLEAERADAETTTEKRDEITAKLLQRADEIAAAVVAGVRSVRPSGKFVIVRMGKTDAEREVANRWRWCWMDVTMDAATVKARDLLLSGGSTCVIVQTEWDSGNGAHRVDVPRDSIIICWPYHRVRDCRGTADDGNCAVVQTIIESAALLRRLGRRRDDGMIVVPTLWVQCARAPASRMRARSTSRSRVGTR